MMINYVMCLVTVSDLSGPAKTTFVVGAEVKKGPENGKNKAYCQVCLILTTEGRLRERDK